ncbi:uncharacterized protein JCM6883_005352 [Sporobolomyces salmoneus]|uniref:uncharacterized protein n=1 Tax=Sporobolomyces salmoneus TaxID=183962 RepID=UPI003178B7D4
MSEPPATPAHSSLEESYLKASDDPSFVPSPPLPRCERCTQRNIACTFHPIQRKGRPPSRSVPSLFDSPPASSLPPSPPPEATIETSHTAIASHTAPSAPVVSILDAIAKAYLSEIFRFTPLLSPILQELEDYFAACRPLLLVSINCMIDPSLAPPPFPLENPEPSLSLLQAATLFALHAYGIGNTFRALVLVDWAATQLGGLGWNGYKEEGISSKVTRIERKAFIALGWQVFSVTAILGALTGQRQIMLAVQLPPQVTPRNVYHHALKLLQDASNFEHVQTLSLEDQYLYCDWIIGRSETIHRVAVEYLESTTRAFDASAFVDSPPTAPRSRSIEAADEQVFEAAILSALCTILVFFNDSSQPRSLFPGLRFDLSQISTVADSILASIARSASQIFAVCQTTKSRTGHLLALESRSPTWCASMVVASFGLLVQAYALLREALNKGDYSEPTSAEGGGGVASTSSDLSILITRQLDDELEFLDLVLAHQVDSNNSRGNGSELVFRARSATFATLTWICLLLAFEVMDLRRSFFRMRPDSPHVWTNWVREIWRNQFLFWSVVLGFLSVFPVVFIPVLNEERSEPILDVAILEHEPTFFGSN